MFNLFFIIISLFANFLCSQESSSAEGSPSKIVKFMSDYKAEVKGEINSIEKKVNNIETMLTNFLKVVKGSEGSPKHTSKVSPKKEN